MSDTKTKTESKAKRTWLAVAFIVLLVIAGLLAVLKSDDCFPDPEPEPIPVDGVSTTGNVIKEAGTTTGKVPDGDAVTSE
jgi:hypothetical protein